MRIALVIEHFAHGLQPAGEAVEVIARRAAACSEMMRRQPAEAARAVAEAHGWDAHLKALRALFERVGS